MFVKTTATEKIENMTARIRAIPGGTSASKTVSILIYLIAMAQTDDSYTLTSVVSESFPHLRRGALRDFLKIMTEHRYFKPECWDKTNSTYTFERGSQIEFFSADQPHKLRGSRRDRLFINEANNIPFSAFEELEVRTKEFIFLDWNPTNEFWYYTDVKPARNDVEEITLTYKDNEALSQEIISSIEKRKNRPQWWKVYGLGELGEVEGRIYTGWEIIDSIPHEARLEVRGLDFGYSVDPTVIVDIYKYNGGYIFDELLYRTGISNREIAQIIKNQEKRAITIADSAEPKSIDEIRGYGVTILPAQKGPGSVNRGINFVQDQKCSVTKRSTKIIKSYRNYLWELGDDGQPVSPAEPCHDYSDPMDAIRYGMSSFKRVNVDIQEVPVFKYNKFGQIIA